MSMKYYMFDSKEIDALFEEIRSILDDDSVFTLRVLEDMEKKICFLEEEVKGLGRGCPLSFETEIHMLKHCVETLQNAGVE